MMVERCRNLFFDSKRISFAKWFRRSLGATLRWGWVEQLGLKDFFTMSITKTDWSTQHPKSTSFRMSFHFILALAAQTTPTAPSLCRVVRPRIVAAQQTRKRHVTAGWQTAAPHLRLSKANQQTDCYYQTEYLLIWPTATSPHALAGNPVTVTHAQSGKHG